MSSRVLRKLQRDDFVEDPDAELSDEIDNNSKFNRFDLVRKRKKKII